MTERSELHNIGIKLVGGDIMKIKKYLKGFTLCKSSKRYLTGFTLCKSSKRYLTGFTLIELLIVIVIIGILAAITVASFAQAQRKSRDAKRKSDLEIIISAINMEHSDTKSWTLGGGDTNTGRGWFNYQGTFSGITYSNSIVSQLITSGYLSKTVEDPKISRDGSSNVLPGAPQYVVNSCNPGIVVYGQLELASTADQATLTVATGTLGCANNLNNAGSTPNNYAVTQQ